MPAWQLLVSKSFHENCLPPVIHFLTCFLPVNPKRWSIRDADPLRDSGLRMLQFLSHLNKQYFMSKLTSTAKS